jgi:hypothetical protein
MSFRERSRRLTQILRSRIPDPREYALSEAGDLLLLLRALQTSSSKIGRKKRVKAAIARLERRTRRLQQKDVTTSELAEAHEEMRSIRDELLPIGFLPSESPLKSSGFNPLSLWGRRSEPPSRVVTEAALHAGEQRLVSLRETARVALEEVKRCREAAVGLDTLGSDSGELARLKANTLEAERKFREAAVQACEADDRLLALAIKYDAQEFARSALEVAARIEERNQEFSRIIHKAKKARRVDTSAGGISAFEHGTPTSHPADSEPGH